MAKKRLNKKLAIIGSAFFVLVVLSIIVVVLYLSRDADKAIQDGDRALDAAKAAVDADEKEEQLALAIRSYGRAYQYVKTDERKVEMRFKLVEAFKLAKQWDRVLGSWKAITDLEPGNVLARFGRLKYAYIVAHNGARQYWKEVESQASEFLEKVDQEKLVDYTAEYDTFAIPLDDENTRLGPYLYMVRGRALAEMGKSREVTDAGQSLDKGIADLKKAMELEPQNVSTYRYLAEAVIAKGEFLAARGQAEEKKKATDEAENILTACAAANGGNAQAHTALANFRLGRLVNEGGSRQDAEALEPQYQALLDKFGSDAYALGTVASYYRILSFKNHDKAIAYCEKAMECAPDAVEYARMTANLYYEKGSVYRDREAGDKAIAIAEKALDMRDAIVEPGPREWANKLNRINLTFFLANCYIERALEARSAGDTRENELWVAKAEDIVHEIEQLMGSGEDASVVRWQGMLSLAKGNTDIAIRKLYGIYERYKASGVSDSDLSYVLARLFENTQEIGAVREFYASALSLTNRNAGVAIDSRKPEALLDYAQLLNKMRGYDSALVFIDYFENQFWENDRSRQLKIRTNIAGRHFEQAQELIDKLPAEDVNSVRLKLELAQSRLQYVRSVTARRSMSEGVALLPGAVGDTNEVDISAMAALTDSDIRTMETSLRTLLSQEPNTVANSAVTTVANYYLDQGQLQKAKELVDSYLSKWPEDPSMRLYRRILDEPEPGQVFSQSSSGRSRELEEEVLRQIKDPMRRAMNLGLFYNRNNEPNEAIVQLSDALQIDKWDKRPPSENIAKEVSDYYALSVLFDLAVNKQNWPLAEKIQGIVRNGNMDGCEGNLLAARMAIAHGDHAQAISLLNQCIKLNPISSKSYLFRSVANEMAGQTDQAIDDAVKASSLNPLDPAVTEHLAVKLFERDMRSGATVTSDQKIETRGALTWAMGINPGDQRLQGLYAEHIKDEEPDKAIAIRQRLQNAYPSVQNSLLLGRMAMELGHKEITDEKKKLLFGIAEDAFQRALAVEPANTVVLDSFAEYYRLSGQEEKAEELLGKAEDPRLMWTHYYRAGKFEDAMKVLEAEYQKNPKDGAVLRGLVVVSEQTVNQEAAAKYSEELLAVEDTIDNRLLQIQVFLNVGLINETENKLQSVKEKYPSDERLLVFEGWWYLKRGQLDKALEAANQYLQTDQDNPVIWRLRGEAHSLMTNYDQAMIDLNRSRTLSDTLPTRLSLARAYLRAGRPDDAVTELKAAIAIEPSSQDARVTLEQTYIKLGRMRELGQFYSEAMKEFPKDPYWFNQAAAGAVAAQNYAFAEVLYGKAWELGRADLKSGGEAFYRYLEVLLKSGKTQKLFEEANKYVDTVFAPVAFFRMGQAHLAAGDRAKAIECCKKAIEKAGDNESLVNLILSEMSSLLGNEETMKYCQERLAGQPDSLAANLAMFYLYRSDGEYNKSVDYIDTCLKITEGQVGRHTACMTEKALTLQMAYAKTSDRAYLDRAVETYESLLEKVPNNTGALNNLAYLLAENDERLPEALKDAEYAHRLSPNDAGYMDTYAYTLYKNGKYDEAEQMLLAAVQKYQDNGGAIPSEVYEHLAMAKEKLGKKSEALEEYKHALDSNAEETVSGTNDRIEAAIERLEKL